MASLIDSLIEALEQENALYEELIKLSEEKTGIIVKGDIEALDVITGKEQEVIAQINRADRKREEATNDIAMVFGKNPKDFTLDKISELLKGKSDEQNRVNSIHDKLKRTMAGMVKINEANKVLLQESLEMVDFEMNLIQSMRQAPTTANYSGTGYSEEVGNMRGSFDAKQ